MHISELNPLLLGDPAELLNPPPAVPMAPDGSSLRDYFAAAALTAALDSFAGSTAERISKAAAMAWRVADEMIARRNPKS